MKFKFDIDCTPEEARRFVGLPDVTPMNDKFMEEMEAKMSEHIRTMDPESFVKTWVPASMEGWKEMQKMFWDQMGIQMPNNGDKND